MGRLCSTHRGDVE